MGRSYGYNRKEDISDYNSAAQLIDMLTKVASNGGNLLLDIGPTADGRIPVIMQQRLVEIGRWLNVNGEAIYGTRRWKVTNEGSVRYTAKGRNLYAICMNWPGDTLVLHDVTPAEGASIEMLGHAAGLTWKMYDGALHIDIPQLTVDKLPCRHAWVLRIPM